MIVYIVTQYLLKSVKLILKYCLQIVSVSQVPWIMDESNPRPNNSWSFATGQHEGNVVIFMIYSSSSENLLILMNLSQYRFELNKMQ